MLWLSPVSVHHFFHQRHLLPPYCSASQKRQLLHCFPFGSPILFKHSPIRYSHISLHTIDLARITSDYRVTTLWCLIFQSLLTDLSATFERVHHSLLLDTLFRLDCPLAHACGLLTMALVALFHTPLLLLRLCSILLSVKITEDPVFGILFYLQIFHTGGLVHFHNTE